MRRLVPALLLPVVCLSLYAETTGRIAGKVLTKDGKPIAGAKVVLSRLDLHWVKELKTDANGSYIQIGLEPTRYDVTASADGYVTQIERDQKIPLGETLNKTFNLLTPEQVQAEAVATGKVQVEASDPAAVADAAGREAFNHIIPLYNEQKYGEALPDAEKAYKSLTEAMATYKDDKAKEDLKPEMAKVERVYGICLALGSPDRKAEAEPFLTKALEANPKDERALAGLIQVAKAKGDKTSEAKYQSALDAIQGPNPDVLYNKAVEAFNAGHTKEAKAELDKVLKVSAKYPEAYYLLAMIEFGEMNLKGTKQNLEKYLELAPNGKNAATARDMLKDPSLKHIK